MGLTPLQKKVLDAYSRDELSSEERIALEESLANSKQRDLFIQYLSKTKKRENTNNSLDYSINNNNHQKKFKRKFSIWTKVSVSLTVLTACIVAVFYYSNPSPSYFDNYYEEFPNIISPLVRGNQPDFSDSAFYFYETSQFDKSFETFGNRYKSS